MKLHALKPSRRQAGILLTECLVYIAVFTLLFAIATSAFYICWDHTRATVAVTDNIENALRAGERWRADIRNATGKIEVHPEAGGETVRIPETGKDILYHFKSGELRRQVSTLEFSELLLPRVKVSEMKTDARGIVNAWRWELELMPVHKETSLPLRFTFEAVPASS
jgi:Tfp pilus assembly protein FimT